MANAGIKGVIEGGQQAPQEAPERDPDTLDMFTGKSTRGAYRVLRSNPRSEARAHLPQTSFVVLRSKARIHKGPSLRFAWSVPL